MVEPATTVGGGGEWVAHGMDHLAFAEIFGFDFPDLFEAEAVGLRLRVAAEVEFLNDLFCEGAVAAFGKEGDAGMEFHSSLEGVFGFAVAAYPKVVCSNAFD